MSFKTFTSNTATFLYEKTKFVLKEIDGTSREEQRQMDIVTKQLIESITNSIQGSHNFLSYFNLGSKTHKSILNPEYTVHLDENKCLNLKNFNDDFKNLKYNIKSGNFNINLSKDHKYSIIYNSKTRFIEINDDGEYFSVKILKIRQKYFRF